MKKYKLTKETIKINNIVLYRIKALKNFSDVKKGELGGFIEKESNLSQTGDCWVYEEAKVCGKAMVYGKARVFGEARVYGKAKVYGKARICEKAKVYGEAIVYGEALVCGEARVYGKAWVYEKARVYRKARVYGKAIVYGEAWFGGEAMVCGEARVYGKAMIYENAKVFENARVCGEARVYGEAIVYGKARICENHEIKAGTITKDCTDISYSLYAQLELSFINDKIILYKRVNKIKPGVYASCYDKNFIYKLNKISEVKDYEKSNKSCASGIHLSTIDYWNEGDTIIACEVNKKDIITIQQGKVRCKKCKVIKEIKI